MYLEVDFTPHVPFPLYPIYKYPSLNVRSEPLLSIETLIAAFVFAFPTGFSRVVLCVLKLEALFNYSATTT